MQDFSQIIGHESIIKHLQNAIKSGKTSHAYIFHGEDGMGKKSLSFVFAKTLQCNEKSVQPCNKCKSCKQADSENHPDIMWITHEKLSIGVDDIRTQINADILVKPYQSRYKIYIIDEADKMTENAQNALLKTIEEPPEYAIILLLACSTQSLLPTILSRCVVLDLKPIDKQLIKEHLMEKLQIPDYVAEIAAGFCGGNVGKAIKYASSDDFEIKKEDIFHILRYIDEMEHHEIIAGIKTISENKSSVYDYIDLMMLWFRDVLMLKATNDPNLLLFKDEFQTIKKQAKIRSYDRIENIIKALEEAKDKLKANVNFDITIELMLLSIKENYNG
ncbi:MAG: DNA polymerase III subunit delta' [Clostridiales bacterium]|jgi:DNA polymerase-3 subunit delta'|nr:DNA polymerase III subunit delta' [Clostridiales bacterium]